MDQLTQLNTWILLEKHANDIRLMNLDNSQHNADTHCKLAAAGIQIDYSKQKINNDTLSLLCNLATEVTLKDKIKDLRTGGIVNRSQQQPALHTALRIPNKNNLVVNGTDVLPEIFTVRDTMQSISNQVRTGKYHGYSGKPITSIVNIGIGGSDFGPRFCIDALTEFTSDDLDYHFVSNIDPKAFETTVKKLNPETTLFIISSKSFTTKETTYNANKALAWIGNAPNADKHFIAVTANVKKAQELGYTTVLPIWDWVGGRYSFCSAINLLTCIAIGYEPFMQMLAGAHAMDTHFYEADAPNNMPIVLALLGLWNINFLHNSSLLMLVYASQLQLLVPYIQQLDMESNGKSIDNSGRATNYSTGPIVWGGLGNEAQHSYYQLLCQGNHKIAADFISINEYDNEIINTFCSAKIRVLNEGTGSMENQNGYIPGGMPINHITMASCTPYHLGALIALYEHKIYVQSVLWDINAFDQPGVESAKRFSQEAHPNLSYARE